MIKRLLLPLWILAAGVLTLYSFTQVSLSLTLTQASVWQDIQKLFQYIGYFNRPLSTSLYIILMLVLSLLYLLTLKHIRAKKISARNFKYILVAVCGILLFSYNAFSHDIFNYIFDAKIFTAYQKNPYMFRALDFTGDPMLSFMQWTHRTYPYGPVWLAITVPFSYIGMQYFLPTFYLFKLLAVFAYLGTAWGIYKIVYMKKKEYALFSAAFFALNPLMIIEFLVSGHNDIVMMFLAVLAMYLFVAGKKILAFPLAVLSVGVKYASGFLAPMALFLLARPKQWETGVMIGVVSMAAAVVAASINSGNFQPWYLSFMFIIGALISYKKYISVPLGILSLFALLHYVPYLYIGNWDAPIPTILRTGLIIAVAISGIIFLYYLLRPIIKRSEV